MGLHTGEEDRTWGLGDSKEFKLYPPSEFDGLFAVVGYETCLYLIDFMGRLDEVRDNE